MDQTLDYLVLTCAAWRRAYVQQHHQAPAGSSANNNLAFLLFCGAAAGPEPLPVTGNRVGCAGLVSACLQRAKNLALVATDAQGFLAPTAAGLALLDRHPRRQAALRACLDRLASCLPTANFARHYLYQELIEQALAASCGGPFGPLPRGYLPAQGDCLARLQAECHALLVAAGVPYGPPATLDRGLAATGGAHAQGAQAQSR